VNKNIIFAGIGGLIAGGIAGFLGGGYYIKKKLGDKYDQDLEEMRTYYRNKCKVDANEAAKAMISEKIEDNNEEEQINEEPPKTFIEKDKEIYENMATDYTGYHKSEKKPKARARVIEEERTKYPISEDEWDHNEGFKKETLYYYNGDDVLTDESDEQCSVQALLGDKSEFLKSYGDLEAEDPKEVTFIRNCENETDYRVFFDERAYEDVMGIQ